MHVHLLNLSWQQEPVGSIPDDIGTLRRWLGLPSGSADADRVWARVWPQIMPAWALKDGRRFNAGMVATRERQQIYKQNGSKKKAKQEARREQSLADEELLNNKKSVLRENPPEDSDVTIQTIANTHPKFAKPFETERAIVEQLDRLGDEMGVRNALNYLLTQTKKYRESYEKWPKEDQKHSPESPRWFASRCYGEPEKNWTDKAAGPHGVDEHGGHFEGTVYITRDGKRMPGYMPPPKTKAKVAD